MLILVVEDENILRNELAETLKREGFAVEKAADGKQGLYLGRELAFDAAIIDLGLPGISGLDLIKQLRSEGKKFPILILTARDHWQDKVNALAVGADDYVTKPFHMEEILARVNALVRRSNGFSSPEVVSGPYKFNSLEQKLWLNDELLDLTAFEYKVIEYFLNHAGKVLSKTVLTEHIYEQDFERDSNVIEVFVGRLRKKLDPSSTIKPIETLRGRGYRWSLDIC
ncbi:MAG: DNA-binding response regulator [Gammaproteobacteria bacterium CG22_combo_CG10-13_8_21_14_all_40_8]|nr:MAG: DNA-binding response regulator [Gammaproteobacteria bacterium CG22_combo_CG10-13_8_21_14_all_40_8]